MNALRLQLQAVLARLDGLSVRERLLVFAAALSVLITLSIYGIIAPAMERSERLADESRQLETQIRQLRARLETQAAPGAPVDSIAERLHAIEARLGDGTRLVETVRRLVQAHPRVRLRALTLYPPQPLVAAASSGASGEDEPAAAEGQPQTPSIVSTPIPRPADTPLAHWFTLGVSLELVGGYDDLTAVVRSLEQLPGLIEWRQLRLDGQSHPDIHLYLEFAAISKEAAWHSR